MSKLIESKEILKTLGFDVDKINEFSSIKRKERILKVFISVASLKENENWSIAKSYKYDKFSIRSREIISFLNKFYNEKIADSSYDDIRRKNLKFLEEANIVENSANLKDAATNNPMRGYSLSSSSIDTIKSFGTKKWKNNVREFIKNNGIFTNLLKKSNIQRKTVPVTLPNGNKIKLSFGKHNLLQKEIIENFLPGHLREPILLYLGDTSKKVLVMEEKYLNKLGFFELKHDMLPDVVCFDKKEKKIYLIEAVHSSNPINQLRYLQLKRFTKKCVHSVIFVSTFLNKEAFRRFCAELSWDSKIWLASDPDHLITFS